MWFKNAINKEKISYLFADKFPINDLLLDMIIFKERHIKLVFTCKNIPETYPDKWKRSDFNALEFVIEMYGIITFESKGAHSYITCSPEIVTEKDFSSVKIEHADLFFYCEAKHLLIDRIQPYTDDRWD